MNCKFAQEGKILSRRAVEPFEVELTKQLLCVVDPDADTRAYWGIIDSPRGESIFATGVPKSLGEPRGGAPKIIKI